MTGTLIWCAASLLGLGLLFAAGNWPGTLVHVAGGAYLAWLSLRILRHARAPLRLSAVVFCDLMQGLTSGQPLAEHHTLSPLGACW